MIKKAFLNNVYLQRIHDEYILDMYTKKVCKQQNIVVKPIKQYYGAPKAVILNRGPHGPPGGNLQVLGGNTEHLGNWGGMDPFGGNQQIAINSPGCSSGWRIVAASPVFVDVTL